MNGKAADRTEAISADPASAHAAVDAAADNPLLLDLQVCFPLYAATNHITRLYGPVLARIGLTYPQYLVMLVLWEQAPQTVGALGARLHLDSGTLTPLLKRLEKAGLVSRTRDPEDERRVLVSLTDQGRALRGQALDVPATMAGNMNPEAIDALRETVTRLVDLLTGK
ncbi:MarR family transcriptional regulator [Novosphingobium sp. 1949]|uniref:MarR family transcriptional regulator n=1 Tax=Novosphingobium organovorum TaxID=2930092 RepID=A0ABT0BFK8_9SPHN|nr:MarR family transcriptional regulator [Novosphingobium organovorum]MCJ2183852.1 MarR family transcriptional regulator [Novosphingobium organovorum]